MRVRISQNCSRTPQKSKKKSEVFKNQKLKHAEVKAIKNLDHPEITPARKSIFNRRSSMKRSSGSLDDFITPLSSTNKENLSLLIRSSSSSGYHSLQKSTDSYVKKEDGFIAPIRRRLNCNIICSNAVSKSKICKIRSYEHSKQSNILPPRAMPSLAGISSSFELWKSMSEKDQLYKRDPNYFSRQKYISPCMREILVEWMLEVCEAYNLDLETFYLSVDYLDRYLSAVNDVPTNVLQSLGTTTLYIASKLHEIVPPSLDNFITVTDGACSRSEILIHEAHILMKINWYLQPITPLSWLTLFYQISQNQDLLEDKESKDYKGPLTRLRYLKLTEDSSLTKNYLFKQPDSAVFKKYTQILYSCIGDPGCLRVSYGVIAASILHLTTDIDVFEITGFGYDEISACLKWIRPHVRKLHEKLPNNEATSVLNDCTNIYREEKNINPLCYHSSNDKENTIHQKENIPYISLVDTF